MGDQPRFYRTDDDFKAFAKRLKQTPCPHCKFVGALIRHGSLKGFDETNSRCKNLRARRIFCSNRNRRPGCGRTFSVWLADKIRRLSLTTAIVWRFLQGAVADGVVAAVRDVHSLRSDRTWQRVWQRFRLTQSTIRTALSGRCPPPTLPVEQQPEAHVLVHLQAAFPNDPCPIAAFQQAQRIFFV